VRLPAGIRTTNDNLQPLHAMGFELSGVAPIPRHHGADPSRHPSRGNLHAENLNPCSNPGSIAYSSPSSPGD
jgi:hypothetical protein